MLVNTANPYFRTPSRKTHNHVRVSFDVHEDPNASQENHAQAQPQAPQQPGVHFEECPETREHILTDRGHTDDHEDESHDDDDDDDEDVDDYNDCGDSHVDDEQSHCHADTPLPSHHHRRNTFAIRVRRSPCRPSLMTRGAQRVSKYHRGPRRATVAGRSDSPVMALWSARGGAHRRRRDSPSRAMRAQWEGVGDRRRIRRYTIHTPERRLATVTQWQGEHAHEDDVHVRQADAHEDVQHRRLTVFTPSSRCRTRRRTSVRRRHTALTNAVVNHTRVTQPRPAPVAPHSAVRVRCKSGFDDEQRAIAVLATPARRIPVHGVRPSSSRHHHRVHPHPSHSTSRGHMFTPSRLGRVAAADRSAMRPQFDVLVEAEEGDHVVADEHDANGDDDGDANVDVVKRLGF